MKKETDKAKCKSQSFESWGRGVVGYGRHLHHKENSSVSLLFLTILNPNGVCTLHY